VDASSGLAQAVNEVSFPDWEALYASDPPESMPWFYPRLDPDVADALDGARGRLLDIGTGPGTQAIALARLGFEVTAVDLSHSAIQKAEVRAAREGVRVAFVQDDILHTRLRGTFDVILDRGCLEVLGPGDRAAYARTLAALATPGGRLMVKCFSSRQDGDFGPYRFTPAELRALFSPGFEVESIRETVYYGTVEPLPLALFCVARSSRSMRSNG
jgi:2-polyprenyl-3-methyl-5-hydroxy-6-metoxy-1,4-benzoquinol methylase